MKSKKKAAAKKATTKNKKPLIEGKYSHKFLTRLEPEIGTELDVLMKETNTKTYNGAVKMVIKGYRMREREYLKCLSRIEELTELVHSQQERATNFKRALEQLTQY